MTDSAAARILWFSTITNDDVPVVGGKNASLGEMYQKLTQKGIRIPNGFVITAGAYREFVEKAGIRAAMQKELDGLDTNNIAALQKAGKNIRALFLKSPMPEELVAEIGTAYEQLSREYGVTEVDVAVRSSATAEDLPGASFAGQQETYLNIRGAKDVVVAIRKAFASLFTDRAISYRADKGFDQLSVALSVGVQKMVRSDVACSGVMFTLDTESGFRDVVEISGSWGLGEMVVQGQVTPDEFLVFKPKVREGFPAIIKKTLGDKKEKMVYGKTRLSPTKHVKVSPEDQLRFTLTDEEVLELARWGMQIEEHYSARAGHPMPMDMEWAKDGVSGELFIVQARPETVQAEKKSYDMTEYHLESGEAKPLVEGIAVGRKIVSGVARVILSPEKLGDFKQGDILVTKITDPDWEPIMKEASAIITEKGGRTSHAAIVSRELGIPAVIGAQNALGHIKSGDVLTVDASSGVVGRIYSGKLTWTEKTYKLDQVPEVKTKACLNVGTPEGAFVYSFLPHKGVGLAREEFIIASQIRIHPLALINFDSIKDKTLKKKIETLTRGWSDKKEYYVAKLTEGIAQIAAAFYPYDVIVRFSDFKTNEYRALIGGDLYEPHEENPMIGWRGASRYAHPDFAPAFMLECQAVKRVRETLGLTNVQTLIPMCRTPEEGKRVLETMQKGGLSRGENGLKVYVMCEIPTNVIRAEDFLEIFDGFSIGSNDLTQLTLGLDRDSERIAGIGNENDKSVRTLVAQAIRACKQRGKYIGFCGQAPSDYPDFTRFLVEEGIDAISLNPDAIVPMVMEIAEAEKKLSQ